MTAEGGRPRAAVPTVAIRGRGSHHRPIVALLAKAEGMEQTRLALQL